MDFKISETCKKLLTVIVALGLIALVIGLFFAGNKIYWILGIIIGTVASLFKVVMLERTLYKAVAMDSKDANNYTRMNYTSRLVASVVVVVVACMVKQIDVVGVVIGLLLVQPASYITNLLIGKNAG